MSEVVEKNIFDLGSDCLANIFKYLCMKDLISVKKAAAGFHDAVFTRFREIGEVSLDWFGSAEEIRAFFRSMPFKLRKLDLYLPHAMTQIEKAEYLSSVFTEVDVTNVTHLIMNGFKDYAFFRKFMRKFRNVRSYTIYANSIQEVNVGLQSFVTGTLEEIEIHKVERSFGGPKISRYIRGFYNFIEMLKKHGSRLRVFKLYGDIFSDDSDFIQRFISTFSEFAPNLESFILHFCRRYPV